MGNLLIDFIFTFAAYTIFPLIYRTIKKGNIDDSKENTIVIVNSIVVFVLYCVLMLLLTEGEQISNIGPAIFYGFINKQVIMQGSQKRSSIILLISSIICFISSAFAFGLIFICISVSGVIAFIVYKNQPQEELRCGNCMTKIEASDLFCKSCGFRFEKEVVKVVDESKICSKCSYLVNTTDVFCQHCGNRLIYVCNNCSARVKKDDTFCQACGNRLKEEKEEENASKKICKERGLTLDGSASFCPGCGCKLTQRRRKRKKKMVKETSEN